MEFAFDISNVVNEEVLKIDRTLSVAGHETNYFLKNKIKIIVDEMGKASAVAQGIRSPVTSSSNLINSEHIVYMMTEHNAPEHFTVVGFLKMGWKKLYLFNKACARSEAMVYCLLDFYVHESKQRQGYGKRLLSYMLQDTKSEARNLAIDRPTKKLLQFMWKNYQLSKLVNQGNNFVIYEEFFDDAYEKNDETNHDSYYCSGNNRESAFKNQTGLGRHGAHKHHDSMGEIVQGEGDSTLVYNQNKDYVGNESKEVNPYSGSEGAFCTDKYGNSVKRDLKFQHDSLW